MISSYILYILKISSDTTTGSDFVTIYISYVYMMSIKNIFTLENKYTEWYMFKS